MLNMITRVLLGLIVTLSISFQINATTDKNYYQPWLQAYHDNFEDIRIKLIAHGLLAPSAHNKQPWKIKLSEEDGLNFDLYVETQRLLPHTDPYHRQILMSQGTFLETLRIAAQKLGYQMELDWFPHGMFNKNDMIKSFQTQALVRIQLKKNENLADRASNLYTSIFKRTTNRTNYQPVELTSEQIKRFQEANKNPNLKVMICQEKDCVEIIKPLVIDGVVVESTNKHTIEESIEVFRDSEAEKSNYRYGLTMHSRGSTGVGLWIGEFFSNNFTMGWEDFGQYWIKNAKKTIPNTPAFVFINSKDNEIKTQVQAGQLYARLQLQATELGLSMQPVSQILQEFPEMKKPYAQIHKLYSESGETIQMLARVGQAEKAVAHSIRLDVMDIIVNPPKEKPIHSNSRFRYLVNHQPITTPVLKMTYHGTLTGSQVDGQIEHYQPNDLQLDVNLFPLYSAHESLVILGYHYDHKKLKVKNVFDDGLEVENSFVKLFATSTIAKDGFWKTDQTVGYSSDHLSISHTDDINYIQTTQLGYKFTPDFAISAGLLYADNFNAALILPVVEMAYHHGPWVVELVLPVYVKARYRFSSNVHVTLENMMDRQSYRLGEAKDILDIETIKSILALDYQLLDNIWMKTGWQQIWKTKIKLQHSNIEKLLYNTGQYFICLEIRI